MESKIADKGVLTAVYHFRELVSTERVEVLKDAELELKVSFDVRHLCLILAPIIHCVSQARA